MVAVRLDAKSKFGTLPAGRFLKSWARRFHSSTQDQSAKKAGMSSAIVVPHSRDWEMVAARYSGMPNQHTVWGNQGRVRAAAPRSSDHGSTPAAAQLSLAYDLNKSDQLVNSHVPEVRILNP